MVCFTGIYLCNFGLKLSTTITLDRKVKGLLEKAEAELEKELGRKLTWSEFLEHVIRRLGIKSLLELDDLKS